MKNIDRHILGEILVNGRVDVMLHVDKKYITDETVSIIYDAILATAAEKKQINCENVKTHIQTTDSLRDQNRSIYCLYIDSLKNNSYPHINGIDKILKKNFEAVTIAKLSKYFADETKTCEAKIKAVSHAYMVLNFGRSQERVHNLQYHINKYHEELVAGTATKKVYNLQGRTIAKYIAANPRSHIYMKPYIIMARPGNFKTQFMIDLVVTLNGIGLTGLIFCLEDTVDDFRDKYLSILGWLNKNDVRDATIEPSKIERFVKTTTTPKNIVCDKSLNIHELRKIVDVQMKTKKIDFVCLDYIQLLKNDGSKDVLKSASNELLYICHDYNIPCFILSQVNTRANDGQDVAVEMGSALGSSAIENDARYMIGLWGHSGNGEVKYKIVKNTWGKVGETGIIKFAPEIGCIVDSE